MKKNQQGQNNQNNISKEHAKKQQILQKISVFVIQLYLSRGTLSVNVGGLSERKKHTQR